jgi:acetyl esterase/lipase
MPSIFSRQPFKALYIIFFFASLPVRLALVALYFIPPWLRQHPKWTFHNAIGTYLFKLLFNFCSTIHYPPPKTLEPGKEKERFVVLNPAKEDLYRDVLDDKEIKPAKIGGVWYPRLFEKGKDEGNWVILHFHGGAYVMGGCRPMEGGWGPEILAKKINGLAFLPQYRLTSHPDSRFPAALQDAVTSYSYLLQLGIPASKIIFSGDSAGGNLALALLRYAGEHESALPYPYACFGWSPWLNLNVGPEAVNGHRNEKTDYIPWSLVEWSLGAFKPKELEYSNPYLSPLGNEFATRVPIFVHSGTAEVLVDDHTDFVRRMKEIEGNRVEILQTENAQHDIFAAGPVMGFVKEANEAMDAAKLFLEDNRK